MIYFLQATDGGPVKIGFTNDLASRRNALERHYGKPLAILATAEGGRAEEAEMHARFAHLRFGRTEQFRPAADLMEFIGRPLFVTSNPDTVEIMSPAVTQVGINIKGDPAWRQWMEEAAAHCRMSVAGFVDAACAKLASAEGFKKKPPKRLP